MIAKLSVPLASPDNINLTAFIILTIMLNLIKIALRISIITQTSKAFPHTRKKSSLDKNGLVPKGTLQGSLSGLFGEACMMLFTSLLSVNVVTAFWWTTESRKVNLCELQLS